MSSTTKVLPASEPLVTDRVVAFNVPTLPVGLSSRALPELVEVLTPGIEFRDCSEPRFGVSPSKTEKSSSLSTTIAPSPNLAWHVNFEYGYVYRSYKSYSFHVRAVRGGLSY